MFKILKSINSIFNFFVKFKDHLFYLFLSFKTQIPKNNKLFYIYNFIILIHFFYYLNINLKFVHLFKI